MFGSIGMPELIIIFVIALVIFGPRKLPELGRTLGKSLSEFRRASNELRSTLEEEIRIDEQKSVTPPAAPAPAYTTEEAVPPAAEPDPSPDPSAVAAVDGDASAPFAAAADSSDIPAATGDESVPVAAVADSSEVPSADSEAPRS